MTVARLTRRFLGLVLLAWPFSPALANEQDAELSKKVVQLATQRLAEAIVALDGKIEKCNRRKSIIPRQILASLKRIPSDDLRLAIAYFSIKADNQCIKAQARDFMVAAYIRQKAEPVNVGSRSEVKSAQLEALVLDSKLRELEYEVGFLSLPTATRRKLEAVEAMRAPFDPIGTAKELGLL